MIEKTLGQIGYEAYCKTTGWKSLISGADLPPFEALSGAIQDAWEKSGQAVAAGMGRADAVLGMMAESLKVGDVVWLMSGGPALTICKIDGLAFCKWFDENSTPYEGHFAPEALTTKPKALVKELAGKTE